MSRSHASESSKKQTPSTETSSCCNRTNPNEAHSSTCKTETRTKKPISSKYHLNTIWSIWYCVVTTIFTSYLVYSGVRRFLVYASLPWPNDEEPYMELNAHVGLVGAAVVVIPFFIASSVIKVGNLPNDGFKLGSSLSTCTRDPPSVMQPSSGIIRNLWLHGVPTSPFLHLISAFCLLLPQTLMGAKLIQARFMPPGEIWRSDLDAFFTFNETESASGFKASPAISNYSSDYLVGVTPTAAEKHLMVRIHGTKEELSDPLPFSDIIAENPRPYDREEKVQEEDDIFSGVIRPKPLPPFDSYNWRSRRSAKYGGSFTPTYGEHSKEEYGNVIHSAPHFPGPFAAPVKVRRKKNKEKEEEESFAPFSPHQNGASVQSGEISRRPRIPPGILQNITWRPFSPELLNYVLAFLIFAIRYPSVFWHTNKRFSMVFSVHLIVTGVQTVIVIVAISMLYKFQVYSSELSLRNPEQFVSNPLSCLILFILAVLTLTVSSSAVYFYGYQRFATFLDRSRKRFHITYSKSPAVVRTHTAQVGALAVLLCLCLTMGPLLWDLSILYKISKGNGVILTSIITSITYLTLWVALWLYLTFKSSWVFKLRVTVARAFVSSARSIKLVNDVELTRDDEQHALTPILVVGNGRAVAIKDSAPQKAIMGVVNKIKEEKKLKGQEEEIYWLRPTLNSSFDRGKLGGKTQTKVTFNDMVEEKHSSGKKLLKGRPCSETDYDDDDDDEAGDYAVLKEAFPSYVITDDSETSRSSDSENSQRSPVVDDPRYVDRNQILAYRKEQKSSSSTDSSPVLVAPDYEDTDNFKDNLHETHHGPPAATRHHIFLEAQGSITPRSTRSNDSGMPQETPSQRSDSLSTSSTNSNTPPENSEESGVHSGVLENSKLRCNSDEDLSQLPHDPRQPLLLHSPQPNVSMARFSVSKPTQTAGESTVAIRRNRHMTREIRPPADPIYGTRKVTSFSPCDEGTKDLSPVPSPVPAMAPLPSLEETGVVGLFPSRHNQRINLQHENPYGQRGMQPHGYPQIPLPPIPQGMLPPPSMEPLRSTHSGIYGRTSGPQYQSHMGVSNGVYRYNKVPIGRSSSLRYPSTHQGIIHKQYTNTLPHVLPRESQYNTNV